MLRTTFVPTSGHSAATNGRSSSSALPHLETEAIARHRRQEALPANSRPVPCPGADGVAFGDTIAPCADSVSAEPRAKAEKHLLVQWGSGGAGLALRRGPLPSALSPAWGLSCCCSISPAFPRPWQAVNRARASLGGQRVVLGSIPPTRGLDFSRTLTSACFPRSRIRPLWSTGTFTTSRIRWLSGW